MTDQAIRDAAAELARTAAIMKQAKRRLIQADDEVAKAKSNVINAERGYEIAEEEFAAVLKDDE